MKKLCLRSGEGIDRISYLPDSILHHILSFLPTEDAFRTVFLSKYWRQVFSSLSTLDFKQGNFQNSNDFKKFVDFALILHRGSTVQNFKLCLDVNEHISTFDVNAWISFAIEHNIRDLQLRVGSGRLEKLPCCLFTCSTLTALFLEGVDLKLPTTISFPNLKTVFLDSVKFFDDYSTNYLFSSCCCPVLEELKMNMCNLEEVKILTISSPTIRVLLLSCFGIPQKTKISTLKLQELYYWDKGFPNISPEQVFSSLVKVSLKVFLLPANIRPTTKVVLACRILARLTNVVSLSLGLYYVEYLTMNKRLLESLPPSVSSLKSLDIDILDTKNQVQVLYLLLKSCLNLETLIIDIKQVRNHETLNMLDMEEYWKPEDLPMDCVLKRLKKAHVSYFGRGEIQIEIAKFVLENASILENMTIFGNGADSRLKEKVLSLTRVSPHVRFTFQRTDRVKLIENY